MVREGGKSLVTKLKWYELSDCLMTELVVATLHVQMVLYRH
jgi:hypothetical protein